MNEEKKVLEGSVFARVLVRLMEAHLPRAVDEEKVFELGEWCGYDPEVFRARLAGDPEANLGDLSKLAYELQLSEDERRELAFAYTYERELADLVPSIPGKTLTTYFNSHVRAAGLLRPFPSGR